MKLAARFTTVSLAVLAALFAVPGSSQAQDSPQPSQCIAIAQALPGATYASFTPDAPVGPSSFPAFTPVQAPGEGEVTITYAGHSTYRIETPGGITAATDFSGYFGASPLPRVVTMNKAHRSHFTDLPDIGIEHVLRGWNPDGGPARHAVVVDDLYVRNVPTDIRQGAAMEKDGNSIFVFEVAGLCIGHLGHLHHRLEDAHYGAIGRLDVVMVPIDSGMTLSLEAMTEITTRLNSSIVLPMHRHSTPIGQFTALMGKNFLLDFRSGRSLTVSLRSLPRQPTIVVLEGV